MVWATVSSICCSPGGTAARRDDTDREDPFELLFAVSRELLADLVDLEEDAFSASSCDEPSGSREAEVELRLDIVTVFRITQSSFVATNGVPVAPTVRGLGSCVPEGSQGFDASAQGV